MSSFHPGPSRPGKLSVEDRGRLLRMYADGDKVDVIAAVLRISPSAVVYHARRVGLRRKNCKLLRFQHTIAVRASFEEKVTLACALDEVQCVLARAGIHPVSLGKPEKVSWTRRPPQDSQRRQAMRNTQKTPKTVLPRNLPLGVAPRGKPC